MSYSRRLQDPRWQKKRAEILIARNWTCETCGHGEFDGIPLNVHHKYYRLIYDQADRLVKTEPWDYPDKDFRVLCEPCHQQTEIALMEVRAAIGGLDHYEMASLADELRKAVLVAPVRTVLNMLLLQLGAIQEEAANAK